MNKDIFRNFSLRKEIREIASPLHKAIAISESAIKARCQEYIAQRKEDIILTFQRTEELQQNQMEILKEAMGRVTFDVQMLSEGKYGYNWAHMKKWSDKNNGKDNELVAF